jgi:hypothetical protein
MLLTGVNFSIMWGLSSSLEVFPKKLLRSCPNRFEFWKAWKCRLAKSGEIKWSTAPKKKANNKQHLHSIRLSEGTAYVSYYPDIV